MSEYIPDWAKNLTAPIQQLKDPNKDLPTPELPNWAKQAIKTQEEREIQAAKDEEEQEKRALEPEIQPFKLSEKQLKQKIINKVSEKLIDIGKIEKHNANILADYIINYAEEMTEKYKNEVNEIKLYQGSNSLTENSGSNSKTQSKPNFSGSFRRSE